MNCKKCSKEMTCTKEKCNFKSWIYTKNYGEVKRVGNTKDFYKK